MIFSKLIKSPVAILLSGFFIKELKMKKDIYKKFAPFYDEVNSNDFYDHYVSLIRKISKKIELKKLNY